MRKHSTSIRATIWHLKFWHRHRNVRIRFFWGELQVLIAWKRGFAPVNFILAPWPSQLSKWNMTLKCFRNLSKYYLGFSRKWPILSAKCHKRQKIIHNSVKTYDILMKKKFLKAYDLLLLSPEKKIGLDFGHELW